MTYGHRRMHWRAGASCVKRLLVMFFFRIGKCDNLPNTGHARQLESDVFNGEWFGQTEDQSTPQMGTGRLMFTASKDNILIIQPG